MKSTPDSQKLRGSYYTPKPIADFLARWAVRSADALVLEPSCGDGVLLKAAADMLRSLGTSPENVAQQLYGVELEPDEMGKAVQRIALATGGHRPQHVHAGDFFGHAAKNFFALGAFSKALVPAITFDAVVGNPPFIRYQNFPEESRSIATHLMERAGLNPSGLMNTWLPFLVASSLLLKPDGRLGMVIPAELFQVNYAAEVRQFLSDYFPRLAIVTFNQLVFPDIQQEVVLLLAEKAGETNGIRVIEIDTAEQLEMLDFEVLRAAELKTMDHSTEKWTQYFLSQAEIDLLRTLRSSPDVTLSGKILDVDVGVVTGQNQFFILNKRQVKEYALEPHIERIVSRSAHLQGAIFSTTDWFNNVENNYPSLLFSPPKQPFEQQAEPIQQYIRIGEEHSYHQGYKCRIRPMWYVVPSVWVPDAFMLRQVHGYPKLILNQAQATCTDTIHRVRFINGVQPDVAVCAFLNSMTFAFAEVTGRSYGGGVLTFEPSEAEKLPIPLHCAEKIDIMTIDAHLRDNKIEAVLDITDQILLVDGLGLSNEEARMFRTIWRKLRDRRINRKQSI